MKEDALQYVRGHLARLLGVSLEDLNDTEWTMNSNDPDFNQKYRLIKLIALIEQRSRFGGERFEELLGSIQKVRNDEPKMGIDHACAALVKLAQ